MEKSSFFNAQMDASGEYDREYLAEDFASYFSKFISNGVFPNPSTGLQVIAADTPNMTVTLSVGYGYINGYKYENTAPLTFSIGVADGVLNRKDAIFIRYSKLGRAIKAYKIAGTPGASAVAPSVVRTEDYYDLCVAIISVNAGITVIPQSLIEDTRLNTSLCGIVTGLVEQVDTTTLYNQIQSDLSQFKTVSQAEFDAWFDDLKGKLGEDPATALQLQVDNLNAAAVGDSFKLKGASVSIAYAGANRIASITAYGETPQGGTVEAPVALTGVDSVQVCGRNLLPDSSKTVSAVNVRFFYNTDGFLLFKGQAYTFASNVKATGIYINLLDGSGKQIYKYHATSVTYTPDTNVRAWFDAYYTTGVPDGALAWLNLGNTAMPYEPYQGSVTQLPIPRALHEVGDVRDICRTRVKSVYDKRIVLNGSEDWKQSGAGVTYLISCNDIALGNHIESSYLMAKEDDALYSRKVGIAANSKNGTIRVYLPNNANPTTFFASNPLTVYYQSTSYNGTNGLDVCLTEYQTGYIKSYADESITTAWISSTGALSTGAEIAYVLSSPETYATDPVDFDNAAGPLTVMTGGELEVRMTELVGMRSPELTGKMDKATYDADGDGVVDRAAVADKVAKKLILQNNAGQQMAEFDGSEEKTVKLTPAQVGAEPTFTKNSAFNKNFGTAAGTVCQGNDGRLSDARRASNISMSYSGGNLWISYS